MECVGLFGGCLGLWEVLAMGFIGFIGLYAGISIMRDLLKFRTHSLTFKWAEKEKKRCKNCPDTCSNSETS